MKFMVKEMNRHEEASERHGAAVSDPIALFPVLRNTLEVIRLGELWLYSQTKQGDLILS